jgi:hypothetical protein
MRPREFTLLCQCCWGGREERLARQVALMDGVVVFGARLEEIDRYAAHLAGGTCVPVGTVEFVRRAMDIAGISEPANLSYPQVLESHLHRRVNLIPAGLVMGRCQADCHEGLHRIRLRHVHRSGRSRPA